MDFLEIILSSAVVVAVINMIMQNKNNKLQYITNERSNWRRELKEISVKLQKAKSPKKMACSLQELKNRINSYGQHFGEYPTITKMDFLKDEHIWKMIDDIEKRKGNFQKNKRKLLNYIELLLKFDWERTKKEVKSERGIIVASGCALVAVSMEIYMLIEPGTIVWGAESMGIIVYVAIFFSIGFLILLLPYFSGKIKEFRTRNWFRDTKHKRISWIMGMGCIFLVWSIITFTNVQSLWGQIAMCFLVGAILAIIFAETVDVSIYNEYFKKIVECMEIQNIKLYYYKDNRKVSKVTDEILELNVFAKYIVNDEINLPEEYENKTSILKKRYRLLYRIKREKSVLRFIEKYPKAAKVIAEYRGAFWVIEGGKSIEELKKKIAQNS